ncbi:MAG: Wzz/FepE/Etk N-terminal domain-containing protein [Pseudoalteromonas prydzensis]|uniref:LPS O-antigen length regulator n=1 Tax=Pseudoalteromonas prydzensis TaxID=182141 RepID=A0ABR9FRA3_9GAMM|nr:Wzz/FepE/Etk N-terminal domain-containing protein [Pseudoalteromonas prydzensis]MBE0459369.1 LPS O-antigen length regulator [Pseudoalteromonas prydzensis]
MNENKNTSIQEISMHELVTAVFKAKWIVIICAIVCGAISVAVAINLPNYYRSEVLLSPVQESQTSGLDGQLGGLASLAGFNLAQDNDRSKLALEVLRSKQFINMLVKKHTILPELMAVKEWVRETDTLIYDEEKFNKQTGEWFRKGNEYLGPEPTITEIHEAFMSAMNIDDDNDSGFVKISFTHQSPEIAQAWLELIVIEINTSLKKRDIAEATRSIEFLKQQIDQAKVAEIQTMLFNLVEEQMKKIMLAETRDEYVFKVIDPPLVADIKFKPKRSLIVVLGVFTGVFLAIIGVILRRLFKDEEHV